LDDLDFCQAAEIEIELIDGAKCAFEASVMTAGDVECSDSTFGILVAAFVG